MEPVNSKSLLSFVFAQMSKLSNGEITTDQANTQANLVKQANNLLNYELKRTLVTIKLDEHNRIYNDSKSLRQIESKNFE